MYDPDKKVFDWRQFRVFARLERKTDESLERYFWSFVSMCRSACRLPPRSDEGRDGLSYGMLDGFCYLILNCISEFCFPSIGLVDPTLCIEPITEERAARTLYRIELMRKVREQVLHHPLLEERLKLCRPSPYLPVWWECGKHDHDLLIGVAKHGLSRTDFYILNDSNLTFLETYRNCIKKENHGSLVSSVSHQHCYLGHCHSPQPTECHHTLLHSIQTHQHVHAHGNNQASEMVATSESESTLTMPANSQESFLDCSTVNDSLDLGHLQHEGLPSGSLHSKTSKEPFNEFPFNSASAGQSMLNSYDLQGDITGAPGDMTDSIDGKLRNDVLVGEQGYSEETGLMAPSVELDELQTPWESSDHAETSDIFNEGPDPILGEPSLETEFLDPSQSEDGQEREDPLTGCLSIPSSDSQSDPVEPLAPSFMLFKDLNAGETDMEQADLSVSPPEYVASQTLALSDVGIDQAGSISKVIETKPSVTDITRGSPSSEDKVEHVEFQFKTEETSQGGHSKLATDQKLMEIESKTSNEHTIKMENQFEPLKVESNVPIEEQPKDHCQVFLEESCQKLLIEPDKVPLTEAYDIPCKGTLEELLEATPHDPNEKLLVKDVSGKPLENSLGLDGNSPASPAHSPHILPSSFPLFPIFPTPLPDHCVFPDPENDHDIKQELLLSSVESEVKSKPDSTTLTPHLEAANDVEVDDIKEKETKTTGMILLPISIFNFTPYLR